MAAQIAPKTKRTKPRTKTSPSSISPAVNAKISNISASWLITMRTLAEIAAIRAAAPVAVWAAVAVVTVVAENAYNLALYNLQMMVLTLLPGFLVHRRQPPRPNGGY